MDPVVGSLPRDKTYPVGAAQCDGCGGHGCETCENKGWVPADHPRARKCYGDECSAFIPPHQVAVYCTDDCALADA